MPSYQDGSALAPAWASRAWRRCSRCPREALICIEARGIVQVSARRGWFVIRPSFEKGQEAFAARRAIERGILTTVGSIGPEVVAALRDHIARERVALATADAEARSFLLGDFHVCLVEASATASWPTCYAV